MPPFKTKLNIVNIVQNKLYNIIYIQEYKIDNQI